MNMWAGLQTPPSKRERFSLSVIPASAHCCPGKFGNASPLVVCGALTAYSNNLPPGVGGRREAPGGGGFIR